MFKVFMTIFILANFALVQSVVLPPKDTANIEKLAAGPVCQICTTVLGFASTLLENNASETEVLTFIEKNLCSNLGPLNQLCVQYVETNGRAILYELGQKIDPSIVCSHFGLCQTQTVKAKNLAISEKVAAGPVCQICTTVLGFASTLLENNASETEVLTFIEKNLCGNLGPLNQVCVQYVETNGRAILYELGQKIDPSIVCNHFGLCQTQNLKPHAVLRPMTDTLNCTLCKLVFKQVINVLKTNATELEILGLLENNLCNATGKFQPECKALISQFGPALIYELANGIDPDKLCLLIGMCKTTQQEKPVSKQVVQSKPKIVENKVQGGTVCIVCQYAVTFIDNELKNNVTAAAIISALDKACNSAPASLKAECTTVVNNYGIQIIQLLVQLGDPTKVCELLKLCS